MIGYNAVLPRNTENAPQGFGPCSQTVAYSHYNNFSAQLPIDPKTGEIVSGGAKEQAEQCLKNIKAVVDSIEHRMSDIVKVTIFIKSFKDIDAIDEIYSSFFADYLPTRSVVAVNALPMDALVQIEVLLSNGEGTIPNAPQAGDLIKLTNHTVNAPSNRISSQTVAFSHYNNISAQLPIDPQTGRLVIGDIAEQTRQCLKNIKAILESIDVPFDDIVKINVHLKKFSDIKVVNEVYKTFFPDSGIARAVGYMPARTVIAAAALPMDALVQIDAVISHGDGTPPQLIEDRHGLIIEANNTESAPQCKLSTQTVAFSHYNHISAQLPIDPKTEELVSDDVKVQAKQCLEHIKTIVESIDHTMEDIVKINIFLKDIKDIDAVNESYSGFFSSAIPARTVIGVSDLPKGASVQIDAVVSNAEGTPPVV